jgi:hypothetical protein
MVQPRAKGFVPVTLAAPVVSGLSLVLPDGLEIRGIGPDNVSMARQLLGCLA